MEGFIPFIYKAIVQYRKEGQVSVGDLFFDEPSPSSYFRLPGDSGRYQQQQQAAMSVLFSQATTADSDAAAPRRSPLRCTVHHRRPATATP
ncbi:hypothetical protein OsI_20200 [Oryza sativa Indica Group]|uniref:Uncharacterized protein n=2 Tax=Oryza TaxID=4527 RepID=B8AYV0_ORYSI|nr:uncharacterized protein LOC127774512 [Oryza glaberrima]EEC79341.1 hypothetical protein OsI_20200 [Oryza sativa Indica Group]